MKTKIRYIGKVFLAEKLKECSICREIKPFSSFAKDSRIQVYGLKSACKACDNALHKSRYLKNREKYAQSKKKYNQTERGKQIAIRISRRQYWKHIHKVRARTAVRVALGNGNLIKQPCQVCGEVKVQAHHEDHSKPLEVMWLCIHHHVVQHGRAVYI